MAEETIFDVVGLFGYVRETNYGRLFEIRAEENASDLAFTPVPLSVHTDNPYRDPCPTLQLVHCLVQADQGGITAVADGFCAADRLRREAPMRSRCYPRTMLRFNTKAIMRFSTTATGSLPSTPRVRQGKFALITDQWRR